MSNANDLAPNSWLSRWHHAGLDRLERRLERFSWHQTCASEALVKCDIHYLFEGQVQLTVRHQYRVEAGRLQLDVEVKPSPDMPPLPRVGLELALDPELDQLHWLGLGPHENYPDRLASARLGRWQSDVDALQVPYIFPSENGGRGDVRQLSLINQAGQGLFIQATPSLQVAARRHSQANLIQARHQYELSDSGSIYLQLDAAHQGVGGDDSWSVSVHPEFQLTEPHYRYRLEVELK